MSSLKNIQRDFLLLSIYIMAQSSRYKEACVLAESMLALGERSKEVILAYTTLVFLQENFAEALESLRELDALDPLEQFGHYVRTQEHSMRNYMKARCLYSLHDSDKARDAIDIYLGERTMRLTASK